ncbi:hypothetical protein IX51_03760 [uncultured archaeon]|nr:hypothetical protein IX51_03760 [uncultured archaeon]
MYQPIDFRKYPEKDFRTRGQFQWAIYDIEHPDCTGTLKVANLPVKVLEVPEYLAPPGAFDDNNPPFMVMWAPLVVSFRNKGVRKKAGVPLTREDYNEADKVDLFSGDLVTRYEPDNEYTVIDRSSYILRARLVATKLELLQNKVDQFGDPGLWVTCNNNISFTKFTPGVPGVHQ